MSGRLHPEDIEAIARRVVELQRDTGTDDVSGLVDVKTLAARLGVSTAFVYEHAVELGGVKLADTPKSPWRFDLTRAEAAMRERTASLAPSPIRPSVTRRAQSVPSTTPAGVPLLPIKGKAA